VSETTISACAIIQLAKSQAVDQLLALQHSLDSARRTINFLTSAAANAATLPPIPSSITIDLNTYNQVLALCPSLKLPTTGLNTKLNQLRSQYQAAVAGFLSKLEKSPLGLIDQLETEINRKIASVLKSLGSNALNCSCSDTGDFQTPSDVASAQSFYTALQQQPQVITDPTLRSQLNTHRQSKTNAKKALTA
jgi:hypothetical protein